ncbi:CGNR zinc finger domain-containing protein [Leifsonia sp. SIMBA_070]|uniref:CGNR zinc finger domain-containing protein n=1 Tax=Leifsonia sp. SIMBA_070 TaxID=3085810 RepID=UPI003978B31D
MIDEREQDLLELLNSAPVVDGRIVETLDDPETARLRDALHAVIRGEAEAGVLSPYLEGVRRRPVVTSSGIEWVLDAPEPARGRAELVLEWARVQEELPGRLRPCANPECNKFLIDHSKPNTARWCSMAGCGNRMKARRHYARRLA